MMYSEFAAATKCSNTEHNREVFHHLEALYSMSNMTKEEVYRIGRKLVVNPVVYNDRLGREGGRYVFVSDGCKTPNGCYYTGYWAEVLDWDIRISDATSVYKLRKMERGEVWEKLYTESYIEADPDLYDIKYNGEFEVFCCDRYKNRAMVKLVKGKK